MTYITTRKPFGNLLSLHTDMGRVFGDLFESQKQSTKAEETSWTPSVDISETDTGFDIRAELPGVLDNDVNVSVTDNLLTIRGEKRQEEKSEKENMHRVERVYGSFHRSFTLPRNVETTNIKAGFKDGVLILNIPKVEEAKPTEIPIEVTS